MNVVYHDAPVTAGARWPAALWLAGGLLFVLLATANGAGYRYGVSDQAFYIPAVTRALDPAAFRRDAALIDAQAGLMLVDELFASLVRATGVPLDNLFLAGYLVSLAVLWLGVVAVGLRVYRSQWLVVALGAAFTLRHRIPRTSANSLEPYFHPRMLAFALGMLAVAAVLRRRSWTAIAIVAVAAIVHVTTALWFAILLGTALVVIDLRIRSLAFAAAAAVLLVSAWVATVRGVPSVALASMDDVWRVAVASKDSLFATQWPWWAWAANLGLLAVLWWAHRRRSERGEASPEDAALTRGAAVLVAVFLLTLPAVASGHALTVQFQISRVFWLVDAVALVYVLALADRRRVAPLVAAVLVAVSAARGIYIMQFERPERVLFSIRLADSPWQDAMRFVASQRADAHVLADPGHAWKYGTSVRVSAARDVFLEEVKDSAIAIYSRQVAARVVERTDALGDFATLSAGHALNLADRYELDYLVTEADLPLPLLYRNTRFRVYTIDGAAR